MTARRWFPSGCGGPSVPATTSAPVAARATEEGECDGCGEGIAVGDPLYDVHPEEPLQCGGCQRWEERR